MKQGDGLNLINQNMIETQQVLYLKQNIINIIKNEKMVWKKEKTRRGLHKWNNQDGNFIYVTGTQNLKGDKIYMVESTHKNFGFNSKKFKTMQEGLKYAKEFMERNNKK